VRAGSLTTIAAATGLTALLVAEGSVGTALSAPGDDPSRGAGAIGVDPGAAPPSGAPAATTGTAREPPPPVASYQLQVTVDEVTRRITGTAVISWRNTATVAVSELWLHQYLQAFAHPRTLFLREPWRRHRDAPLAEPGGLELAHLTARELGGRDLWPGRDPHSPGDPEDDTDIRVPLPRPVAPGERLTLTADFVATLPRLVERSGFEGDFVFAAQWFPKLARLERDGSFAHFAYHPQAEFYADFGDYDVALDLPADWIVGATGERTDDRVDGDRRHLRFVAHGVHDFAWSAWTRFEVREERVGTVALRLLYPPGYELCAERTSAAVHAALPRLAERYGPYPYPTLTVVHPPADADAAGGMEYPTLIATGGPWYAPLGTRAIEAVTVHELAHQWFYGLIASNEQALPVLDEGLASYADGRLMRELYGAGSALDLAGVTISVDALRRAHAAAHVHDDVVVQPAPAFSSFASIGALVYSKTAVTLDTIAAAYGQERLDRALARYARQQRYRHPTFTDLRQAVEREVGPDAARALELALVDRGWIDLVATAPRCAPDRSATSAEAAAPDAQVCRAVVYRHGSLRFPVDLELGFDDGTRSRERWDGEAPWTAVERRGPPRLVSVHVDPDRRIALDAQRLNDVATSLPADAPRTNERLTYLAALALGWLAP
jgi:hypothetical protein